MKQFCSIRYYFFKWFGIINFIQLTFKLTRRISTQIRYHCRFISFRILFFGIHINILKNVIDSHQIITSMDGSFITKK